MLKLRWPTFKSAPVRPIGVRTRSVRDVLSGPAARSRAQVQEFDSGLLSATVALLLFGLVMVYSATIALPDAQKFAGYTPTYFLMRHAMAILVGVAAATLAFSIPVRTWERYAPHLFVIGLVLLFLVLIPGIGKTVYGARRWLAISFINFQPSEFMKLFVVLYVANYTVRKQRVMHEFRAGFVPMAMAMAVVGLSLLLEPDLGAFIVMVGIAMGLLFIGGINGYIFAGLGATLTVTFSMLIWLSPWRRDRIFAYLDPFDENNTLGRGYQLSQSLIAFGRGEWFGVGLGGSLGKLHYLPEAHTDFLLAVIGEELGLAGVLVVIFLFFWLMRRSFEIGRQSIALERNFAGLVAKGIAVWIGFQAFVNMGVNLGLLPTKGLTLPFMSYGRTGIVCNCIAIGILLRIDFENRRYMRGKHV